jgi:glycosyltransferase involved in cell wall biosynthesis
MTDAVVVAAAPGSSRPSDETAELPMVSVVIPAFNEALMLMSSLTEIYLYLHSLADRYRFEMIVVNDGSTDETGAIADVFAASRPEVMVLHHKVNFRIGQALRYGFGRSTGRYVVAFDSDLSYAPEHIGRMVDALISQHARVVVASPYMTGGRTTAIPWNRRVMSAGVNRILSASTQSHVATVTGMVRAYDGQFLRSLTLKAMGPEINTEILYKAQIMRARIIEVPAHLDWSGQTERLQTRKVSLKVSATSKLLVFASFLFRPIVFFVVPGLVLLLISLWSIAALALTVLRTARAQAGGLDSRFTNAFALAWDRRPQTFIIAGFSFVVAVQMISLGVLAMQAKRYFEEIYYSLTGSRERIDTIAASPSLQEPPEEPAGDE